MNLIDRILAVTILRFIPKFVTPNHLTIFRFLSVPLIVYLIFKEEYALAASLFAISAVTDLLDGAIARTRGQITEWGRFYDPIVDKFLISAIGSVLIIKYVSFYLAAAIVLIELLIGASVLYQMRVHKRITDPHLTGKLKMAFQSFGIFLIFLHILAPQLAPISFAVATLYVSLIFGIISFVYKSA